MFVIRQCTVAQALFRRYSIRTVGMCSQCRHVSQHSTGSSPRHLHLIVQYATLLSQCTPPCYVIARRIATVRVYRQKVLILFLNEKPVFLNSFRTRCSQHNSTRQIELQLAYIRGGKTNQCFFLNQKFVLFCFFFVFNGFLVFQV